jgi:phosphatidylglycerol:prolipoprotein diacylglycerol transferase
MMAIGIISAVTILSRRAKRKGYNEDNLLDMSIIAVICGLLGGKLLYIITDLKNITNNTSSIRELITGGLVVYGSILGGAIGVVLYCRKKQWNVLEIFDLTAPGLILAQGFGRIGCFLAGCCYGKETSSILGVEFSHSFYAPAGVKLIPTQLMSSGFDFLLAFFLLWYSKKERKNGKVFSLYVIFYSLGRFFVEFLRGDSYRGFIGILSTSQFISIFTFIAGILVFNKEKIFKK